MIYNITLSPGSIPTNDTTNMPGAINVKMSDGNTGTLTNLQRSFSFAPKASGLLTIVNVGGYTNPPAIIVISDSFFTINQLLGFIKMNFNGYSVVLVRAKDNQYFDPSTKTFIATLPATKLPLVSLNDPINPNLASFVYPTGLPLTDSLIAMIYDSNNKFIEAINQHVSMITLVTTQTLVQFGGN